MKAKTAKNSRKPRAPKAADITPDEATPEEERQAPRWAFPSVVRCPRCGTTDNVRYSGGKGEGVQYRRCLRATCRYRFTVKGEKVD